MKKNKTFLILVFIILIIFISGKSGGDFLKEKFYSSFAGIGSFFWEKADFYKILEGFLRPKRIILRNELLEKENIILKNRIFQLKEEIRKKENREEMAGNPLFHQFEIEEVEILFKKRGRDIVVINKGTKNGIKKGDAVVSKEGALFGKITKTGEKVSEVDIITNKGFRFSALIEKNGDSFLAVFEGGGDYTLFPSYLSSEKAVGEKALAFTAPLGEVFPSGILVGEVEGREKVKPYFKRSLFAPLFFVLKLQDE